MSNPYISPFAKPVYVMLKPVGSVCNLACEYCYYLEKGKLYPEVKNHIMSEQLLEKFIKEYLECQTMPQVLFTVKKCCIAVNKKNRYYQYHFCMSKIIPVYMAVYKPPQTVDKVPVFAGTFTMSTVFLV